MRRTRGRMPAFFVSLLAVVSVALSACAGTTGGDQAPSVSCTDFSTKAGAPLNTCDIRLIRAAPGRWGGITGDTEVLWAQKIGGRWFIAARVGQVKLMAPVSTIREAFLYSEAIRTGTRGETTTPFTAKGGKWRGAKLAMAPKPRTQKIHYLLFNADEDRQQSWRSPIPGLGHSSLSFTAVDEDSPVTVSALAGEAAWSTSVAQSFANELGVPLVAVRTYSTVVQICHATIEVKSRGVNVRGRYPDKLAHQTGEMTYCNSLGRADALSAAGRSYNSYASRQPTTPFSSLEGRPAGVVFPKPLYQRL
jgi:hypothetical protein